MRRSHLPVHVSYRFTKGSGAGKEGLLYWCLSKGTTGVYTRYLGILLLYLVVYRSRLSTDRIDLINELWLLHGWLQQQPGVFHKFTRRTNHDLPGTAAVDHLQPYVGVLTRRYELLCRIYLLLYQ